ncbi:MAG: GNAT family protein [Blautia sp.]|nr:GNAT family protein [Blautia sp.]
MEITLEKWKKEDAYDLMRICNETDRTYLSNRLPYPYTEENASWWLNMVSENEGKRGIFRSVRVDGEIVGNITVEQKEDVFVKDAELGYLLLPRMWSRGIMSEAVRQICEIAFAKLDIVRITGQVYEPNVASRRILEKNGFELEGILKKAVFKEGKIWNLCVYGKTK